jgi:hypothetical protein
MLQGREQLWASDSNAQKQVLVLNFRTGVGVGPIIVRRVFLAGRRQADRRLLVRMCFGRP